MAPDPAGSMAAHPRSRGENADREVPGEILLGSSPLTRGKQRDLARVCCGERLIPAHAGKTIGATVTAGGSEAHPRSRGENSAYTCVHHRSSGSSPLTRGKRFLYQTYH